VIERAGHRGPGPGLGRVQARRDLYFYWHASVHWRHNRQKQGERKAERGRTPSPSTTGPAPEAVEDQGWINGDGSSSTPRREAPPEKTRRDRRADRHVQLAKPPPAASQDAPVPDARAEARLEGRGEGSLAQVVPARLLDAGETVGLRRDGRDVSRRPRIALGEAIELSSRGTSAGLGPRGSAVDCGFLVARPDRSSVGMTGLSLIPGAARRARPFAGLPALRARWAAGERPPTDLPGLALLVPRLGDESFARRRPLRSSGPTSDAARGLEPLRPLYLNARSPSTGSTATRASTPPSRSRSPRTSWPGREQMLAPPVPEGPPPGLVPQPHRAGAGPRRLLADRRRGTPLGGGPAPRPCGLQAVAGHVDNVLEQTELVTPGRRYHESTDYNAHHVGGRSR